MNFDAYAKVEAAQREYLLANGWLEKPTGGWSNGGETKSFGHAVNSQLSRDRGNVNMLPEDAKRLLPAEQAEVYRKLYGPWTPEEQSARFRRMCREAFAKRHEPNQYSNPRQNVRSTIRWISKNEEPKTRVELARRRRADHARHHKQHGCSCGKEGPPW